MRPTHVMVDLEALRHNVSLLRKKLRPDCQLMAVVKADGYGHGALEVSQAAIQAGASYLGVAIPEEGIALRQEGVLAPILVLGGILPSAAPSVVAFDLEQTVFSCETCEILQYVAVRLEKECKVHVKVDTGMNRVGIRTKSDFKKLLSYIQACPNIRLEGMCTHFAVSEIEDKSFTHLQFRRFMEYVDIAHDMGFYPRLHCSNSGAILDLHEQMQLDMVRAGITMYGYAPHPVQPAGGMLRPVMAWKTHVMQVKEIGQGETVSYGRNYTAPGTRKIATIPVGYGDGYKRNMSGKAQVLIHGQRAAVVGTICMDQCMVDVSGIHNVHPADEVVLIGRQGDGFIGADEMALWADTVSYEILLSLLPRVPRNYEG